MKPLACAGVLGGECAAALAAGINVMLWHDVTSGICALQVRLVSAPPWYTVPFPSFPARPLHQSNVARAGGFPQTARLDAWALHSRPQSKFHT